MDALVFRDVAPQRPVSLNVRKQRRQEYQLPGVEGCNTSQVQFTKVHHGRRKNKNYISNAAKYISIAGNKYKLFLFISSFYLLTCIKKGRGGKGS